MRNEGTLDRIIRAAVAVAAVVAAVAVGFGTAWGWVLLAVGAIAGVTAAVGFCPLYRLFGLSTCPVTPGRATSSTQTAPSAASQQQPLAQ